MPQIGIADKQTLDNTKTVVDTVNTKVGVNTDLAGTTTVFARVRQIYEYMVNTLLVAINGRQASWGAVAGTKTNIDNTATTVGTINTNVNTVNTNINTINTKIGVSTDTGATTLFGLIKNSGGTNFNKLYRTSSTETTDLPNTVLNISGSGYLMMLGSNNAVGARVRVDGQTTCFPFFLASSTNLTPIIRFNSSILVTTNGMAGTLNAFYILD